VTQRAGLVLQGQIDGGTQLPAGRLDGQQAPPPGALLLGSGVHRAQDAQEVADGLERERILTRR
jgi:hypothetical protein